MTSGAKFYAPGKTYHQFAGTVRAAAACVLLVPMRKSGNVVPNSLTYDDTTDTNRRPARARWRSAR